MEQKKTRLFFIAAAVVCLAGLITFLLPERSAFHADKARPESNRASGNEKPLKVVIGSVTIDEPHVIVHLGGKKEKTEPSILDKISSVGRATMSNGKIEISFISSSMVITLNDANAGISDFSPAKGGRVSFSSGFHFVLPEKRRIELKGSGSGNVVLAALTPTPNVTALVKVNIEQGVYGPASFNQLAAKATFSMQGDEISFKAAELALVALDFAAARQAIKFKDIRLKGDVVYNLKSETVAASSLQGSIPPAGEFKASLSAAIKGPLTFKAFVDTPSLDIAKIFEMARAYLPADYQNWSAQGKAAAQTDMEGTLAQKALTLKGSHRVAVTAGGLSIQDGSKAVQGVNGKATFTFGYSSSPEKLDVVTTNEFSGGEFLWGTYYNDFSSYRGRANAGGTFRFDGNRPFSFKGDADIFGAGSFTFSGSGQKDEQIFVVDGKEITFKKVNEIFLENYFKQNVTSLAGLQISGQSAFGVKIRKKGPQTDMNGLITIDDTSFTIPAQKISVSGMRLNLPFDMGYPKAASAGKAQEGLLEIKSAEKDRIRTQGVRIPLLLSGNKLRLPEDTIINVARGNVMITGFAADDILSPERKISCGIRINNVSLRPIERSFTTSPITGTISADYPKVEYYRDVLTANGKTKLDVFGGEIEIGAVSIGRMLSSSRKIDTNITFKDISLEKATEKIALGKMTGIIQGSLKNVVIEYGQPARFILDIDSVDTKGVSQKISVEAIQSISILGSGSGMSNVLNRGITSFFKEYPYSRIGIRATLENDVFIVRGKIHEGNTEYLVRRGFLRGVDVVNQNPDNKISFNDMMERLNRIFESRKAGGTPAVQ